MNVKEAGSISRTGLQLGDHAPRPPEPQDQDQIISNWKGDLSSPLVSIKCNAYNHAGYIRDAINSFLMQRTNFPFEVIIHDDASADGTDKIISEYMERYPFIIRGVLQKENQYSQGKRPGNFTAHLVRGKYIALCEGDDYWLDENKLQIQADFLESNPGFAVCGHDACVIENGIVVRETKLRDNQKRDFSAMELQRGVYVLTLSAMFVNKLGEAPPEHSQVVNGDDFFLSRLGEFGGSKYLPEIIPAVYRRHEGGVWSLVDDRKRKAHSINTQYWIMQYYSRKGNSRLATYFASKAAANLFSSLPSFSFRELVFLFVQLLKMFFIRKFSFFKKRLKK
ncbi:glycosyltransferase [Halomonas salipaludis]|nr:glycosyltransferase [Halomonas salipaludis]